MQSENIAKKLKKNEEKQTMNLSEFLTDSVSIKLISSSRHQVASIIYVYAEPQKIYSNFTNKNI